MTDESSEPSDSDEDPTRPEHGPPDDGDADAVDEPDGDEQADRDATGESDTGETDDERSTGSPEPAIDDTEPPADGSTDDGPGDEDDGGFEFGDAVPSRSDASASTDDTADDGSTPEESTADERASEDAVDDDSDADAGLLAAANRRTPFPDTSLTVLASLVAMTVAGFVLRFVNLGARVAHQDEGRVGYWIIRYLESGVWEYRAIVHGPFLFHVNKYVFEVLGPSDFSSRVAVAVIGALLPLTAWLFREHLRDSEVVALGLLLTLNPVLVYYSRFMRNDVPLAAFMLLAAGLAVRYYDTRRYRYVYGSVGAFAVGMTTKENGLLYAACWLGAAALLLDHRMFVASRGDADRGPFRTAVAYGRWLLPVRVKRLPAAVRGAWNPDRATPDDDASSPGRSRPWNWIGVNWTAAIVAVTAVLEFLAIIVFFYAPRGGSYMAVGGGGPPDVREDTAGEMGLYSSLDGLLAGDTTEFRLVVEEALVGSWQEFTRIWGGHEHSYTAFLKHYVEVMIAGALVVSAFAVVGFLVDRYGDGGPRDLVALASYWGFVSVLGYPIATDIQAGWATAHAIVPLAIPAAVGLAIVIRWGVQSFTLDDGVGVALAVILLLSVVGWMGFAVTDQVYANPQSPDNEIIQYAQPSTDSKPTLERVRDLGMERGGPGDVDVLFWGDKFAIANESGLAQPPAPGPYYDRRVWMWYMEMYQYDANQTGEHFVYGDTDDSRTLNETRPPVVVALGQNEGPKVPKDGGEELHQWLVENGYERVVHQRYGDDPDGDYSRPILFYVRENPEQSTNDAPLDPSPGPITTANATAVSWSETATSDVAAAETVTMAVRPGGTTTAVVDGALAPTAIGAPSARSSASTPRTRATRRPVRRS
ncbi:flippase activity-associated protein Agl23 [Halorubellus sp. PRR65]|uniref:flippase activity-associated protein Agl23 n=1 Tax=Halorubellus sp. PRR65 TaxID=3098148 RepID=UPI002B26004B|nr:flippase activity-associated protein Agl23 [Halorubellus sp. PRR65]